MNNLEFHRFLKLYLEHVKKRSWADHIVIKTMLDDCKRNYELFFIDVEDFNKRNNRVMGTEEQRLFTSMKELVTLKNYVPVKWKFRDEGRH